MRPLRPVTLAIAIAVAACSEPTSSPATSTFTADVRGSTNERITGAATASFGGDWLRQNALSITLPNGETFSGVALAATNGATISFFRSGADLPVGTYSVGLVGGLPSFPKGGFSGAYVVRRTDGLQLFLADSGTLTIAQTGSHVTGTFRMFAKHFDVIPLPTPENVGKPLTPLARGESPLSISGSFDAVRR